jgi:hypothetical protein
MQGVQASKVEKSSFFQGDDDYGVVKSITSATAL